MGTKKKEKKGNKFAIIVAIVIAVIVLSGVGAYAAYLNNQEKMKQAVEVDTIYNGISVNGIDLSGKTKEEAEALLEAELTGNINQQVVTIKQGEKVWQIPFTSLDAQFDIKSAVNEAYNTFREGTLSERYNGIKKLEANNKNIEAGYMFSTEKILAETEVIAQEVKVEPINASMIRQNGAFVITDAQIGYDLNKDSTIQKITDIVSSKTSGEMEIEFVETQPTVNREAFANSQTLIGTYSTTYSNGDAGRNENLRVGTNNINGTIVMPGETFSANVGLGPQTYEAGYKDAAVYVNGKVEKDVAGGVCQITTTLYNAVIRAELEIVERHNHSLTVGYVPLGLDAAVAGDYKDLKFKNNTDYPIYIETYAASNRLVANIYGYEIHDSGRTLEFESVHLGNIEKPAEKITRDPNLPEGQRKVTSTGKVGHKVEVYKKVYQNGSLVSRDWFSRSEYMATADEVTVGTKKVQETVPEPTEDVA